jgi:hypothetical protein
MDPIIARVAHNMVERVTGPMKFRLLLQPCMATFFAIRSGLQDAKECKPPYFWGLFTDKGERESMTKVAPAREPTHDGVARNEYYSAKADNFSATRSTYKGINHGKAT